MFYINQNNNNFYVQPKNVRIKWNSEFVFALSKWLAGVEAVFMKCKLYNVIIALNQPFNTLQTSAKNNLNINSEFNYPPDDPVRVRTMSIKSGTGSINSKLTPF